MIPHPVHWPGQVKAGAFRAPPPLSLYVHVPWCVSKCPYCDFNSHEQKGEIPEREYVDALIFDLDSALPSIWGRRVETVFIGGGTPSLLSPAALDRLLAQIRMRLALAPEAEITLEANPGTVETGHFAACRNAGITRLSLGIQSFDDRHLHALGRVHDGDQARRAVAEAARHFTTFNLDLMIGLPEQTQAEAMHDIRTALDFAPPHLSCYQLTIEANTRFAAAPPTLPEADACADMHDAAAAVLAAAGYDHYETSAFAIPGHRCRHNLNYWNFGDYLGIGAGAHSKLTLREDIRREMRWKNPRQYLAAAGRCASMVQEEHFVAATDRPFEFMMNALRLTDGFAVPVYEQRTGLPWISVAAIVRRAAADGLIEQNGERVAGSAFGQRFLNRLLERFIAD